jgi:hypothetical protein
MALCAKVRGHKLGAFKKVKHVNDFPSIHQLINVEDGRGIAIGNVCPVNIDAIAKCVLCDEAVIISVADNCWDGGIRDCLHTSDPTSTIQI